MALLAGLGILIMPAAEALGGQLFKYFGYYAVYSTSMAFTVIGIIYIYFVPESVTRRDHIQSGAADDFQQEGGTSSSCCQPVKRAFIKGYETLTSSTK